MSWRHLHQLFVAGVQVYGALSPVWRYVPAWLCLCETWTLCALVLRLASRQFAWPEAQQPFLLLSTYVDIAHVWELPSHQPGWLE